MESKELITTDIIKELLCKEGDIPPKYMTKYYLSLDGKRRSKLIETEYLRKHGLSSDGRKLWDSVNFEYFCFHSELKAYFDGKPSQLENLDEEWRDYLEAKKDWFLALYNLIRTSWKYLDVYHIGIDGKKFTPGLLTAEILEWESRGKLAPLFSGRCEVAARRNYELSAKIAKVAHLGESAQQQLYKDSMRKLGEFSKHASLEVAVLSHCRCTPANEDKYVKSALKNYDLATLKLSAVIVKDLGYAKTKMQTWDKGSITT